MCLANQKPVIEANRLANNAAQIQLQREKAAAEIQVMREKAAADIETARAQMAMDMQLAQAKLAQDFEIAVGQVEFHRAAHGRAGREVHDDVAEREPALGGEDGVAAVRDVAEGAGVQQRGATLELASGMVTEFKKG